MSSICWRCLQRPSITNVTQTSATRAAALTSAFSTSSSLAATPIKKKTNVGRPLAAPARGTTLRLSKNKKEKTKKPPAVGERKAIRKRIVLSNTNAFEVSGLQDWAPTTYAASSAVGKMIGLSGEVVDSLRAIEAFKPTQGWGFFRRPATLVRKETLELAKHIEQCTSSKAEQQTLRRMIAGDKGSGKSVLLLQAQAMAFMAGWVVIHIPEAQDLVIAHTAYAPIPKTEPTRYSQKDYSAALLSQILKANEAVLSKMQVTLEHNLAVPLQPKLSLFRLAELGARDPDIAWPVFEALWAELTATVPASNVTAGVRPPVLLSLDGLPHICKPSEYISPNMHYIHSHDLALVHHFLQYLSGAAGSLPNGGMVLAADCGSGRPTVPALDLSIKQNEVRAIKALPAPESSSSSTSQQIGAGFLFTDPANPYQALDKPTLQALSDVQVMRVTGFSKDEARAVLEYYARSGMLRQTVTEGLVSEKWTLSGGGVIGELERGTLRIGL